MKFIKLLTCVLPLVLAACGGGGGDPGSSGGGTNPGKTGTVSMQLVNGTSGNEKPITSFAASDLTVRAKAKVLDKDGAPVTGAIVTFSEDGGGLLAFSPSSATALTDSAGSAEIDVKAATLQGTGATKVKASADIPQKDGTNAKVEGSQNIAITGAITTDPQITAAAINFKSVDPANKSIVIAGAGGNGRSETALLTFTVIDNAGAPVKGVVVNFSIIPEDSVVLNTTTASTNSSGEVIASVNSKSTPTSVIVKASVNGRPVSTQSDTLTVTTDIATQRGFDLSASKFNMDYDLSGDLSTLTVRVVDKNGNPVADGVPVVAVTPYGSVGSSGRGGCTTNNGGCTVEFKVQNPRPVDGVVAPVVFSTQTGQGDEISDSIGMWITSVGWANFYSGPRAVDAPLTSYAPSVVDEETCKLSPLRFYVGTPKGFALPAGTSIAVRSTSEVSTPTIVAGSPTLDRAGQRTVVDVSSGRKEGAAILDEWVFTLRSPGGTVKTLSLKVSLPTCVKPEKPDTGTGTGTGSQVGP